MLGLEGEIARKEGSVRGSEESRILDFGIEPGDNRICDR